MAAGLDAVNAGAAGRFGDARDEFANVQGIEKVTGEFVERVKEIAAKLGLQPIDLLAVMSFESGFSPSVKSKASSATGLIQFLESTANDLGTTTAKLAKMTAVEQLAFVEKYLRQFEKQLAGHPSLEDTYMAVLAPAAIGKGPGHVLFRKGTSAYAANRGLDANGDGTITVAEAAARVRARIR